MTARFIDQSLFADMTAQAAGNPRQRQHHNFHSMDEACHRMLVGMQPDTYLAPHRHLAAEKAETLLVLQGSIGLLLFDEQGELVKTRVMQAAGECQGVDLPPGQFHALVVLEADTLLFECKAGPYRPLQDEEWAPWAPREGAPGVEAYRQWMKAQFD
jgi:cupin fold WbuC family metalloprotein